MQLPLALFAGIWLNLVDTGRTRDRIRRAFGYFVPSHFVEQVGRRGAAVTGPNRVTHGVCLATDMQHYTRLAESMPPDRLGQLMNAYYARLFVPVERFHGVVVDVVGDAMVAVFHDGPSAAEIRRRACAATLAIRDALRGFDGGGEDRPAVRTRFGLHAGEMMVGSVGASAHYEFRAVGDAVNTASRIQDLNKTLGTSILASADAVEGVDGLGIRPLGCFVPFGKARPVHIVEVVGWDHEIEDRQRLLHRRFAAALADYRAGRLDAALDAFAALQADDPADGPTAFYLARCRRLQPIRPAGQAEDAIVLEQK